jgi:hypothetical protein
VCVCVCLCAYCDVCLNGSRTHLYGCSHCMFLSLCVFSCLFVFCVVMFVVCMFVCMYGHECVRLILLFESSLFVGGCG